MTTGSATVAAARHGRETLATALLSLQTAGIADAGIERAIESTAAASSALYSAEAAAVSGEAATRFVQRAAESLQRAIADVNLLRPQHSKLEPAATSLTRTLALLYPVLKRSLRQRRARLPAGGLSDAEARELRLMAGFPPAPAPLGRARRPSEFAGSERRPPADPRVCVEVEIGLTTDSNIYTGLALDLSAGGVFVATYQPGPPGTQVSLHFVLPDGHAINADGVVRWTRAAAPDAPPGMGVAFVGISAEAQQQLAEFCARRPPLDFDE